MGRKVLHSTEPVFLQLLQLALYALGWTGAGIVVAFLLFGLSSTDPDPIRDDADAAQPLRARAWLYPVAAVLAILASFAYPMGFAS
jgi:hypothetical protein